MIPESSLDGLTAEDLRLLLNGVGDINVPLLISYTSFNDESGLATSDRQIKFKRWLWSIVDKMTPSERQDLVIIITVLILTKNSIQNLHLSLFLFCIFSGIFLDRITSITSI